MNAAARLANHSTDIVECRQDGIHLNFMNLLLLSEPYGGEL